MDTVPVLRAELSKKTAMQFARALRHRGRNVYVRKTKDGMWSVFDKDAYNAANIPN